MDIISFNEASTANGRIESFIENPDSTSGVLTVPKTIAAGETITIPAGRVAILPDLQVDGDLVIDGDLFIPTGSMTSQVIQKVTSTDNAVVRFDGTTGQVQNSGIFIDDNNNVGIGTSSPTEGNLHIHSTTTSNIKFTNTTTGQTVNDGLFVGIDSAGDAYVFNKEAKTLNLGTNNLHRMIIDSSGNVGIGVTPNTAGVGYTSLQIKNCASIVGATGVDRYELTNAYFDGTAWRRINATQRPTRFTSYDGNYVWSIASSGAAGGAVTFTDAMTLDASGNLTLGNGIVGNHIMSRYDASYYTFIKNYTAVDATPIFENVVAGVRRSAILANGTYQSATNVYGSTSDIKLKENVVDATPKLEKLMQVQVRNFNYIGQEDKQIGVIAQEIEQIFPSVVFETKDTEQVEVTKTRDVTDEEGNVTTEEYTETETVETGEVTKNVKYSVIYMMMLKGLQEMNAKVEAMQLEINELKGAK